MIKCRIDCPFCKANIEADIENARNDGISKIIYCTYCGKQIRIDYPMRNTVLEYRKESILKGRVGFSYSNDIRGAEFYSSHYHSFMYPHDSLYMYPQDPLLEGDVYNVNESRHGIKRTALTKTKRGLSLEDINRICSEHYDVGEKRIIVLVLARFTIPAVQKMIYINYDHWHWLTDKGLDFFWLGYIHENHPSIDYGNDKPLKNIKFDFHTYNEDIKSLSHITKYTPDDVIGLLLCNYYEGRIHYEQCFYISIENLVQSSQDTKLRQFMNYLITASQKHCNIDQIKTSLIAKKLITNMNRNELVDRIIDLSGPVATIASGIFIAI